MAKRSNYQDRVIRRYYQNQDQILIQRLGDLITDLYLAEGNSRVRLWKRTVEILEKLRSPTTASNTSARATIRPWWRKC